MDKIRLFATTFDGRRTQTIISNGSERGDFVPMSHIFNSLKYVHDGVQTIKVYHPNHPVWSSKRKISEFSKNKNIDYAWDYEYDDYEPFDLLEEDSKTHNEFVSIKNYGSDIHLSLTLDLALSNSQLERIFSSMKKYGKIYLKINHESNGIWFSCNKHYTYKEIADFFMKCHTIIKNTAPNISTVFNLSGGFAYEHGAVLQNDLRLNNDELAPALDVADFWSINIYSSLNYGWPFYKKEDGKFNGGDILTWWRNLEEIYLKMIWANKMKMKQLFINEFNSDSDIDGYQMQANTIQSVYERICTTELDWLKGITLYQYRDKGGLGLEMGDRDNYKVLPSFDAYKKSIKNLKFEIRQREEEWIRKDYVFNWSDSESIRGLKISSAEGLRSFTNRFSVPVFLVMVDAQEWIHLEQNESVELSNIGEIVICIPPSLKDDNEFSFFKLETDIRQKAGSMINYSIR